MKVVLDTFECQPPNVTIQWQLGTLLMVGGTGGRTRWSTLLKDSSRKAARSSWMRWRSGKWMQSDGEPRTIQKSWILQSLSFFQSTHTKEEKSGLQRRSPHTPRYDGEEFDFWYFDVVKHLSTRSSPLVQNLRFTGQDLRMLINANRDHVK